MRSEFLPFAPPALTEKEIEAVTAVLRTHWLSSGPKTKEFEEAFKSYVGAPAALALNSATAGLHLAMLLNEIGPDTEVITTPMTFCATANVVEHCQGNVVLADVDPETLLIDPKEIAKKITKKTKMILPVHYAGQPADMPVINKMAKDCGAVVVEDAAHCMPTKAHGKMIGSGPNMALFSFYANKNMTTGEGGMMTASPEVIDRARVLALHGMTRNAWNRFAKGGSWRYDVEQPGFKYNLTDIASALGLVQLSRLEELYSKRMKIVEFYENAFRGHRLVTPLKLLPGMQSAYHLYVIQLNLDALTIGRDEFVVQMSERNIGCSVHYTPIHMMSYYAKKYGWKPESFPNATRAFERMLSIPLNSVMNVQDAGDVVSAIDDIGVKFKR